jgi:hypothetical protein
MKNFAITAFLVGFAGCGGLVSCVAADVDDDTVDYSTLEQDLTNGVVYC